MSFASEDWTECPPKPGGEKLLLATTEDSRHSQIGPISGKPRRGAFRGLAKRLEAHRNRRRVDDGVEGELVGREGLATVFGPVQEFENVPIDAESGAVT